MDKIINLQKTKFYKNDILDLKEYPIENNEYKTKRGSAIIDLSSFESIEFKELIKNFIEEYLFNIDLKYIHRKKSFYIPLTYFLEFLSINNKDILYLNDLDYENLKNKYTQFLTNKNITYVTSTSNGIVETKNLTIIYTLFEYERKYIEKDKNIWDKDSWNIDELPLSQERINETSNKRTIVFFDIKNKHNKDLLKMYLKHLIITSNDSFSTIKGKFNKINSFLDFLNDKNIENITSEDVTKYYEYLNSKNIGNFTYNSTINKVANFLDYLLSKNVIKANLINCNKELKLAPRHYKLSSVEDYIINQIFNNLDKIDEKLRDMFLISYCTGMRASEVSLLKLNCLYSNKLKSEDGELKERYFIQSYSTKLKKYNETPIPKILYDIIKDRIEYVKTFPYDEQYLFNSCKKQNKPYIASTYNEQMKKELNKIGIKYEDGSDYNFNSHDFRHTLATDMINMDIPFEVIRRILHHVSPEMTLYYAEIKSRKEIDMQKEFINNMGEKIVFEKDIELGDLAEINWLRKNINAQILPNGFCGLPTKMGQCDSGNYCLECSKFRTDETFLEVHKQQLETSLKLLENAKENGWEIQIATNQRNVDTLKKIISTIEKGK